MITEDYVSFELSKLLKEKGFDESVNRFYETYTGQPLLVRSEYCRNSYTTDYAAPTLQMAMKWLREVHNIHADIIIEGSGSCIKYYSNIRPFKIIYSTRFGDSIDTIKIGTYSTYEETVEAAIKYCLENLI